MEKGGMEPADLSERPQEAGGDKSAGGPPTVIHRRDGSRQR
jgi:hypothetical protein